MCLCCTAREEHGRGKNHEPNLPHHQQSHRGLKFLVGKKHCLYHRCLPPKALDYPAGDSASICIALCVSGGKLGTSLGRQLPSRKKISPLIRYGKGITYHHAGFGKCCEDGYSVRQPWAMKLFGLPRRCVGTEVGLSQPGSAPGAGAWWLHH